MNDPRAALTSAMMPTPSAPNMNLPPATSFAGAAQNAGLPPMQAPGGGPPPLPSGMNFAPTNLSPDQALAALKTQGLPTAPVTSLAGAQQNAGLPQMQAPRSPMPLASIGRGF